MPLITNSTPTNPANPASVILQSKSAVQPTAALNNSQSATVAPLDIKLVDHKQSSATKNKTKLDGLSYRIATEAEVGIAMQLAIDEGWNVGKEDAKAYFKAFPEGCHLLIQKDQILGAIFLANYDQNLAFVGLYIVAKELRGAGFGAMLWQYAMDKIKNVTSAGLYGVPTQVPRYNKSGFNEITAINRFRLKPSAAASTTVQVSNDSLVPFEAKADEKFLSQVADYDTAFFPASRFQLIKAMLEHQQTTGVVYKKDGKVMGYGLIRACQIGYRLGPVCADTLKEAKELTQYLINGLRQLQPTVILDIPSYNQFSGLFTAYFGFEVVKADNTTLMVKGDLPHGMKTGADKTYAVCSLELG